MKQSGTAAFFIGAILCMSVVSSINLNAFAELNSKPDLTGPPATQEGHPPIHIKKSATATPTGVFPTNIRHAYGLDHLTCSYTTSTDWNDPLLCGHGQVIAIVDAYNNPKIESDLATFSSQFTLPACTTSNGCLAIVGQTNKIKNDQGWGLEEELDVQWAHTIAPGAKIVLVEAKSAFLSDLLKSTDIASSYPGVHEVSMSWGGSEFSSESLYDSHFQVSGVIFFASSGDRGAGVMWPAISPDIVAVGGTTLILDSLGNVQSETGWSGSGGGVSIYEPKPTYQSSFTTYSSRSVPDVSYDADPNTGVPVYDSYGYQGSTGWFQVGGTSAGAPQWASIIAIANSQRSISLSSINAGTNTELYQAATVSYGTNYRDIQSGSNGFSAGPGYDLITGLGSPLSNGLIQFIIAN